MPSNIAFYFPTSPRILTDDLFIAHGGATGTSSSATRLIAYQNAEYLVADYLNTFLSPTNVTGTYVPHPIHGIRTDFLFVQSVNQVIVYSADRSSSCVLKSNTTSCVYLRNAVLGVIDLKLVGSCGCSSGMLSNPYQVEIAYTAGIPSGTFYNSPAMTALALLAQDELDELVGDSVTPGGIAIIEWENQEYREKYLASALKDTLFGSTPRAQRIRRLLSGFRYHKYAGL